MIERYNELPPEEHCSLQDYLEAKDKNNNYVNEKYFRSFSKFYKRVGPASHHKIERRINDTSIDFPIVIASEMTQTSDRSVIVIRSSQAEFDEISYRMFTYTFESIMDNENGSWAEYESVSQRFGIIEDRYNPHPNRFMQFDFARKGEYSLESASSHHASIILGEDNRIQNHIIFGNDHALDLDPITNLDIPSTDDVVISFGRLALQKETAA